MVLLVLHWYYIYISKPHPVFHLIACLLLLLFQKLFLKKTLKWRKTLQTTVGISLMYIGYYITCEIVHFGFLPFYAISLIGLRKKLIAFYIFSVVTGTILCLLPVTTVVSHVLMNVGRLLRIKKMSITSCIISSLIAGVAGQVFQPRPLELGYREMLAIMSTFFLVNKSDRMDIFSLFMCFSYFWGLLLPFLHSFCLDWYRCYENNHFYRVKRSYLFFTPIAIIILRAVYAFSLIC